MSLDKTQHKPSGLRPPQEPPEGGDAFDVAMHYLGHWEAEFSRARGVVKSRASLVVIAVSSATALIAVVSAATAITGFSWLGIVSAALAGFVSVIGAWDGLFRHRELWLQRSLVLGRLQEVHRLATFETALDSGARDRIAREVMTSLNQVLSEDLMSWSDLRAKAATEPRAVESR